MVTIAITGGNGDVGTESSKQLCAYDEVTKIILTCRSKAKADKAIENLVKITGKDPSFFGYVLLDVMDIASIKGAIKAFPKVDRLCLNIGGLGKCKIHEESGAVDGMVMNTLGQVVLANGLIDAKKVTKGGRIVYVGSEVSRPVYSFKGLLPDYWTFEEDDIEWSIKKVYKDFCSVLIPVRAQLGDYKNAKIVGQLYFSHMAKVYPDIFFMTVSPGAIGGKDGKGSAFTAEGMFPLNTMKHIPWMFSLLQVTHDLEVGSSRLIEGCLVGETKWVPGSMILSPPPFWGAKGDPVDNRPMVSYLKDEGIAEKTYDYVNEFNKKWIESATD